MILASPETEVETIRTIGVVLVALITAGFGYLAVVQDRTRRHAKATREQVQNTHETNLRDDLDELPKENTMSHVAPPKTTAAKAVVGSIIGAAAAGVGTLYVALDDGIVTAQEWVGVAASVLVALGAVFGGVYATANKPKV
jgi:hypothetical protein